MAREDISFGLGPGTKTGNTAYEGGIKINNNFKELYTLIEIFSNISIVTENKGFSLIDNDLTINANWEWLIRNQIYTNPDAVVFANIPLSAAGKTRLVYVVPNDENSFTMLNGLQVAEDPQPPELPNGGMYITFFEVSDTEIGEVCDTYDGDNTVTLNEKLNQLALAVKALEDYKKSQAEDFWNYYDAQEVNNDLTIPLSTCSINLTGSLVELHALIYNIFIFMPADGNLVFIKNSQENSILIKHEEGELVDGRYMFSFSDEQDLEVLPNQIIAFKIRKIGNNDGKIEAVGVSSGSIDESNLMHLTGDESVDDIKTFLKSIVIPEATEPEHAVPLAQMEAALESKLDAADYNDRYKGKYTSLANLETDYPTANSGDYAQVDEGEGFNVVSYNWDQEEGWIVGSSSGSGANNTDELPEGSANLYFSTARVLATLLSGISFATGGAIVSTDSILVAFGKLQKQITDGFTASNIKTILGISTLSGSNTGDQDLSGYAKKYGTRTVLSGTAIDWSTDTDTYTKTLTANTTLTDVNLPTGTNTRTIVLSIDGAFTLTVPSYWKYKGGVYSTTKINQIVMQCVNGNSGSERVNYVINADL